MTFFKLAVPTELHVVARNKSIKDATVHANQKIVKGVSLNKHPWLGLAKSRPPPMVGLTEHRSTISVGNRRTSMSILDSDGVTSQERHRSESSWKSPIVRDVCAISWKLLLLCSTRVCEVTTSCFHRTHIGLLVDLQNQNECDLYIYIRCHLA